jgi:hypothetical protein
MFLNSAMKGKLTSVESPGEIRSEILYRLDEIWSWPIGTPTGTLEWPQGNFT